MVEASPGCAYMPSVGQFKAIIKKIKYFLMKKG